MVGNAGSNLASARKAGAFCVAAGLGLAIGVLWSTLDFSGQPRPGVTSAAAAAAGLAVDKVVVDCLRRAEAADGGRDSNEGPSASQSGIPEMLPVGDLSKSIAGKGKVHVEASALMGAGVASGVAQEIVGGLDEHAQLIQKVRKQPSIKKTLAAADILLAIAPDMPELIRNGVVAVDASPIRHRSGQRVIMYDIREDYSSITARIHGRDWDIGIQIMAVGSGVDSLWQQLREAGAMVRPDRLQGRD